MSVLLKSFLILSFRARALPVFPSILTPKSLPRNRRTRTLSSVSASTFQSPPPSVSPETPTPIPPLSDSLRWVSCTAYCGDLSNQDVGFRVRLCGWVALHRVHGGLSFFNLRDHTGIVQTRTKTSGFDYSPLNNSSRLPSVFLYGRDSEHWLIILEFPERPKPLKEEMIDTYVKTLASVVGRGSEKENILCLYNEVYWVSCYFSKDLVEELRGNYKTNGFLKVSCNGGLNQMRAAICDMVIVARLLNLTLVVPKLDKTSFWADPSDFGDIFDVSHFIDSLMDEVRIIKRLPKKFNRKYGFQAFRMSPVSWSNEKYYLEQILPLFSKHKVVHFNRTDTRLANNGIQLDLQKLRCRVNFQGLKFTPEIETLGYKLVRILQDKGPFVALHLRYEMDMLAFSGCTHGCTVEEAEELKRLRYAYPWWREKEIMSEERRQQGLCPLTPEEATLVLQALGFDKDTQIYIASGEIFGSERRLASLRAAFPHIVKKETILDPAELQQFQNHSSQMAALDFMVSVASNTFIPTYYGNMAKVVEGHRRYLGFKRSVLPDRKKLVELLDLHQNGTLPWNDFALAVRQVHEKRMGQPFRRRIIPDKPKEEDYFYANPEECLCEGTKCEDLVGPSNSSTLH